MSLCHGIRNNVCLLSRVHVTTWSRLIHLRGGLKLDYRGMKEGPRGRGTEPIYGARN